MTMAAWFAAAEAGVGVLAAVLLLAAPIGAQQSKAASAESTPVSNQRQFLDRYCVGCHKERLRTGGMTFVPADSAKPSAQPELWEKVVRKRTGVMPPPTAPQPPESDRLALLTWLETSLDAASAAKPNPGRTKRCGA